MLGCAAAAGNSSSTKTTTGALPVPYTSPVTPLYQIPSVGTGFIMGYYINPGVTPISQIDFKSLKTAGITDVYVLVKNDNYLPILTEAKTKADSVGIKTHAWVFPGFSHASEVAGMDIGVHLDVETYDMPSYIPMIKAMREDTQGVTFSLCVKPEGWDDNQYYYMIAPLCDYIVPMLYIGDYPHSINGLKNWAKVYNALLPGKIVAGLQTYDSYQNVTPVSEITLLSEIKAVQPNTRGVILFRYGLSNFNG
ncbi:hypothetical protein [Methanobacterium sp.]|uniref:hypothetical protein n=1 Tax=Methanobacterium sp. TaxID=2164 RepID=UPI0025D03A76|nr:hypothetical protein [Methanobacterium sp.]MBI5458124.1 hypothetical protein [Methanobacterium sp.]